MSLTQLLGGPQFDTVTNLDSALYADFHYFFNSGSVIRTNPWNSPSTPVAKRMQVTNITANDVALNYVNTSGSIVATTLSGSESRIIISQTLPLGLDTAPWLSVGSVTNHTGSVIARPTGSRWFEMAGIRTIAQSTNMYTIADSATTITKTSLASPVSGSSFRYACSRTIPYLDQPFWLIRDLFDCTGGTTTTTTTTSTTTTTTTLAPGCFIYDVRNNGVGTGFVNYVFCGSGSVYRQFSLAGGASGSICVDNYQINDGGNLNMVYTLTSASCTSGSTTTTSTTTLSPNFIEYLVVAGGGGGGWSNSTTFRAGGGGAGGFLTGSATLSYSSTPITVTVGTGGDGAIGSPFSAATNGGNSVFNSLVADGGGFGGSNGGTGNGGNGGSGGGARVGSTAGTGIAGEGTNGSIGTSSGTIRGGSGGGAGTAATNTQAGSAKQWLDGNYYANGGKGDNSNVAGIGGLYGNGSQGNLNSNGDNGGSGVVIIRYSGVPRATGGTITNVGGFTYHTFTTSGNFTFNGVTTTTTTTTTAGPTTTTTTLASQKYLLTSCSGPGDIIGVFTILNAPLLANGDGIRIAGGGIAGLYCFYVNGTSTGTSLGNYSVTNIYRGVPCDNCTE